MSVSSNTGSNNIPDHKLDVDQQRKKLLGLESFSLIFDKSVNAIDINALQKLRLEHIVKIHETSVCEDVFYTKKPEFVNAICRNLIRLGFRIFGIGIVDIINNEFYGFVRSESNGYFSANDDFFLSTKIVKRLFIRCGDEIKYMICGANNAPEKRIAITDIIAINNVCPSKYSYIGRAFFDDLVPHYPSKRINIFNAKTRACKNLDRAILRIMNLFVPIGYGQRAMIIAPSKSGKTMVVHNMAEAVKLTDPNVILVVLLIGERPEEITDFRQKLGSKCKIFASDFSDDFNKQVYIADLCVSYVKRLVELGMDVVLFIDSLTRLSRACSMIASSSGKTLSGGAESSGLQRAKKMYGIARAVSTEGSVTCIVTCLVDTNSRMDEVIYEENKGTGNADCYLIRYLAERNVWPAIDIMRSGTRKSYLLLSDNERHETEIIRTVLAKSGKRYYDLLESVIHRAGLDISDTEFFANIRGLSM